MKNTLIFSTILVIVQLSTFAQQESLNSQPQPPKRFIDRVEVFAGPNLSFNHGNKFIENYREVYANGNYVENKRLTKLGYSIGIGVYHPVSDRVYINLRLLLEQKGYKSELNTTLSTAREFRESDYTYNYFTIPLTAKVYLDKRKRFAVSFGGYVSQLNSVSATEKFYNTLNNTRTASSFIGRTLVAFDANGGINTAAFIPGLQGFAKYDYGCTVGFNYDFKLREKHSFTIQLIDNFGLANVNKENFTVIPSPDERNHTISLMVGYFYQRKSRH